MTGTREHPHDIVAASPLPDIGRVGLGDLVAALQAGWSDFRTAPAIGILFTSIYVIVGLLMVRFSAGTLAWTLVLSLGFPLVAPFAAVGFYEVSRRLETGESLSWGAILGAVVREKDRQLPWMGAIIVIYFLFWTFLAHMIFALFMGPAAMMNISSSLDMLWTPRGMTMIAVELCVGAILAFLLFSLTVMSLPLLLDREVDFVTAMLVSLQTVRQNLFVMLVWGVIIGALTLVAMVPFFLGLFLVLPVLGHATWHLYRRTLR